MDQDNFNKIVTSFLLVFCSGMFAISWYTGKPLDLQSFLVLLAPILTHLGHIVTDTNLASTKIKNGNVSNGQTSQEAKQ